MFVNVFYFYCVVIEFKIYYEIITEEVFFRNEQMIFKITINNL